jgi:hypothetical protein
MNVYRIPAPAPERDALVCSCGSSRDLESCGVCKAPACPACRIGTGCVSDGYVHVGCCFPGLRARCAPRQVADKSVVLVTVLWLLLSFVLCVVLCVLTCLG